MVVHWFVPVISVAQNFDSEQVGWQEKRGKSFSMLLCLHHRQIMSQSQSLRGWRFVLLWLSTSLYQIKLVWWVNLTWGAAPDMARLCPVAVSISRLNRDLAGSWPAAPQIESILIHVCRGICFEWLYLPLWMIIDLSAYSLCWCLRIRLRDYSCHALSHSLWYLDFDQLDGGVVCSLAKHMAWGAKLVRT